MPVPFKLVGIDHVVYAVDDLARAVTFYTDVLGCEPGYTYPAIGMEQLWCGSSLLVLWDTTRVPAEQAPPARAGGSNVDHICIATTPFDHDALRAHLAAHGVAIEAEAFHGGSRGMGHSFYVRDPFGNKIEIKGLAVYPDGRTA